MPLSYIELQQVPFSFTAATLVHSRTGRQYFSAIYGTCQKWTLRGGNVFGNVIPQERRPVQIAADAATMHGAKHPPAFESRASCAGYVTFGPFFSPTKPCS